MLISKYITPAEYETYLKAALLKHKLLETDDVHLVLYSDGGCKPNPNGVGSIGLHGYIYNAAHTKTGHGCKGFTPTAKGHVLHAAGKIDDIKAKAVTVLGYIECLGAMAPPCTNNTAELSACIAGLELIRDVIKPKSVHFILDSKYVLNGIEQLAFWKGNHWRLKSGDAVANIPSWRIMDALVHAVKDYGLTWGWTKGHKDDVGNNQADFLAGAALTAGLNGNYFTKFKLSEPKGFWVKEVEFHPFLKESKWYYQTGKTPQWNDQHIYHFGNHSKDDKENKALGVRTPDARFAVCAFKNSNIALETLRAYHDARMRDHGNVIVVGFLDNITKPTIYNQLENYLTDFMTFDVPTGELRTSTKVPLTDELYPARKSREAVATLQSLENILLAFLGDPALTGYKNYYHLTDITGLIYESVTNKKGVSELNILIPVGKEFSILKQDVNYYLGDTETLHTDLLTLVMGLDMPARGIFLNIMDLEPKVYVVTWPETDSTAAYRYATIVVTNDAAGVWASPYANLRIVA